MKLRLINIGGGAVATTSQPNHHQENDNNNNNNDNDNDKVNQVVVIKKEAVEEDGGSATNQELALVSHPNSSTLFPLTPSPYKQGNKQIKAKEVKDHQQLSVLIKRKRKPSVKSKLNVLSDLSGKLVRFRRAKVNRSNTLTQVKSPTVIRAEEIQLSLGSEFPSFIKLLVRSHVSSCFWMGLPMPFCKLHLPKHDCAVILEDENGEQFEIKYIEYKTGLSAGWRKFANAQRLLEGDVLLFQLVEPTKFKVYVIRDNDSTEMDGALSLLNLDATKQSEAENEKRTSTVLKIKKRKHPNLLPLTAIRKVTKRKGLSRSVVVHQPRPIVEQSGNDSEEVGSEVFGGYKISESLVSFKDLKSFEDFHIVVNGLCIDVELSEYTRVKYYELCSSKNAFLHDRLLPGLCSKIAAGVIDETVKIAEAIKGCKLSTSLDEFSIWEKFLKSFDLLGMNVGFLRHRLSSLKSLVHESEGGLIAKTYTAAKSERTRTVAEIRNLEARLVELKEASEKCGADMELLRPRVEEYEFEFQEKVDAPW